MEFRLIRAICQRSLLAQRDELGFVQEASSRQALLCLPSPDNLPGARREVTRRRLHVMSQRSQGHLHYPAILLGKVQVGFSPLSLFSHFRTRPWLPFSRFAWRFLFFGTGILG